MKNKKKSKNWLYKLILAMVVGFINGFFGGGGGLVCVPTLEKVYKLPTKKAHATAVAIMLPISLVSSLVYILNNTINISIGLSITAGVLIGGLIGALLLKKISGKVVRWIFIIVLFSAGIRMCC